MGCRRAERGEEGGWGKGIGRPERPEPSAKGQEQREGPGERGQRWAVSTTSDETDSQSQRTLPAAKHDDFPPGIQEEQLALCLQPSAKERKKLQRVCEKRGEKK